MTRTRGRGADERGQATIELVAAIPVVIVVGLVLLQLLAVGYAAVLAANAAEAGALALAAGGDAPSAARQSLPGWSRARAGVAVRDGAVRVRVRPPSPLATVARRLAITAHAAVEVP